MTAERFHTVEDVVNILKLNPMTVYRRVKEERLIVQKLVGSLELAKIH